MKRHELTPISNFQDALTVRIIRNECRLFMTNDTSKISPLKQLVWYFGDYKKENKNNEMTCFLLKLNNKNSGFGLIRKSSGKYWITGGLKKEERGKGVGKVLFHDLLENIPNSEVWLEVLSSNLAARKIYTELGFKKMNEKEINGKSVLVMRLVR